MSGITQLVVPVPTLAIGATKAEADLRLRSANSIAAVSEATLFVWDFEKTEAVTASYLKASLLYLFQCGQLDARSASSPSSTLLEDTPLRPIPAYIAVKNVSNDVAVDIDEFVEGRGLPLIELKSTPDSSTSSLAGKIRGKLDRLLRHTLSVLIDCDRASAATLAAKSPEDSISLTGWNNRLAELYRLRLVKREREGKFWLYESIINTLEK